ncbi:MAG: hypothetical protein NXI01_10200 [Gammaproteobacteria bacterium]|nr:hypothetical protein [Gammaproteobacteria bacterium]
MRIGLRHPICLGALFFGLQLALTLIVSPEKSICNAWLSLASHWDSEWYAAIAQHGYVNTNGPEYSGLLTANVVFFPGYPYLARGLVLWFGIKPAIALLMVSQTATFLFWCVLFYILRSSGRSVLAALLIAVFPTSWFLLMGYSESVFLLCCCAMLGLATKQHWSVSWLSGIGMTATRLIGLPVLAAPLLSQMILNYRSAKPWRGLVQQTFRPIIMIPIGALGCVGFLGYCATHLGSWHLYFDMERIHWKGTSDPGFLFKLPTWVPPPWGYHLDLAPPLPNRWTNVFSGDMFRVAAYTFSEMLVPMFIWISLFFGVRLWKHRQKIDQDSLTWYIAAVLMLLFSCFSLSTRYYESMSRCLFPVWVLLIVSDALNLNDSFFFSKKTSFITTMVILISSGFWLQMLNRFLLGWWVA